VIRLDVRRSCQLCTIPSSFMVSAELVCADKKVSYLDLGILKLTSLDVGMCMQAIV